MVCACVEVAPTALSRQLYPSSVEPVILGANCRLTSRVEWPGFAAKMAPWEAAPDMLRLHVESVTKQIAMS